MDPNGRHHSDAEDDHVSEIVTAAEEEKQPSAEDAEVESPYTVAELAKHGMARLDSKSEEYEKVKRIFLLGMGPAAANTTVVAVQKNVVAPSAKMRAWKAAFKASFVTLAEERGGRPEANLANAFYGASRDAIANVIKYGFTVPDVLTAIAAHKPFYGIGCLHLSPPENSLDSAMKSVKDECGLRHVLLCNVIRGKMEQVKRDSKQIVPSSQEFDSGVDSLASPTKYIIWNNFINTRIIPRYILIFSSPDLDDPNESNKRITRSPASERMIFPVLISKLSEVLNPQRMTLILQNYNEFQANKISRPKMVRRLRELAGDELLKRVIKSKPNQSI